MQRGKFPSSVRLSDRAVGWYEHEIEAWCRDLPRAADVPPDPAGDLPRKMAEHHSTLDAA